MNTGGEVAGIVAGMYADLGKKGIEISSKLASYLLLAILKGIEGQMNTGQISMKKLLESGEELKQIKLNERDRLQFVAKAQNAGLTFALLDEKADKNGMTTIFFKAKDIEIVEALLKEMNIDKANGIEEKLDKSIIDEFCIITGKEVFTVDNNNPENHISVELDKLDIQKGYIINPNNPDEYIYFDENRKDKKASIEINNEEKTVKYDTSSTKYDDIKKNIKDTIEKWGAAELVYSDEERLKLKDKIKDEKDKKAQKQKDDRKTIAEVEREVKNIRDSQPSKDNKTKNKSKSKAKKKGKDR